MMSGKRLWGIMLIVVGLILGLNVLGITNIDIFFDGWWTLFIIVPCLVGVFDDRENRTSNVIGFCIGFAFLLVAQDIINFRLVMKLIIPFVMVVVGISFLFGDKLKKNVSEKFKSFNKNDLECIVATFSEQKINRDNEKFDGCNIDAIFGSVKLDLRRADISKEIVIKASSIFGNIEILLPGDANVVLKSMPIFGEVSNRLRNQKDNKKTVYIEAFCLFGGVDIK